MYLNWTLPLVFIKSEVLFFHLQEPEILRKFVQRKKNESFHEANTVGDAEKYGWKKSLG